MVGMFLNEKQQKVLDFVKMAHGEQKRKYVGTPYWTHPLAVARLMDRFKPYLPSWWESLLYIEISLLHDVIEDTKYGANDIFKEMKRVGYGDEDSCIITDGVVQLTDIYTKEKCPDINRKERKMLQNLHFSKASSIIKTIKLCDLIHNSISIVRYDKKFAKVFVDEMQFILHSTMIFSNEEVLSFAKKINERHRERLYSGE